MRFYHYTSRWHLERILRDQKIKTTESNIRADGSGPRVVWLTTGDPDGAWSASRSTADGLTTLDKAAIRIAVELSRHAVEPWAAWARAHGMAPALFRALTAGCAYDRWFIVTQPIVASRWRGVERRTEVGYAAVADPSAIAGEPAIDAAIARGRAYALQTGSDDLERVMSGA